MASYEDYLKELERIADEHIIKFKDKIKQLHSELAKLREEDDNLSSELNSRDEYNRLVQLKNNVFTEDGYQYLANRFRSIGSYKDSAKLASECDEQCCILKERREEEERKRVNEEEKKRKEEEEKRQLRIEQSNKWAEQGLCRQCGGKMGGLFTKKCKSCGKES